MIFVRIGRWQEGEGHEGHEAPRHEEEEGRGCRGGADEGHAEEVSGASRTTSESAGGPFAGFRCVGRPALP